MRATAPRRLRRAALRAVASAVLVALGLGLAPATASATEPAPPAAESETPDGAEGDSAETSDAEPTTLVVALASAHAAGAGLVPGGVDPGVELRLDEYDEVVTLIGTVIRFLEETPIPDDVDVEQLLADARHLLSDVEGLLPDRGEVDETVRVAIAESERLRGDAERIAGELAAWAAERIAAAVGEPPTTDEVLTLAREIEAYVRGEADRAAAALLGDLAGIVSYVTDEQHERTVTGAVTTLLLTLSDAVDPLPGTLAPTAEAAFSASGAFAVWADELARQAVGGPGPFEEEPDPAPEEQAPADTEVWLGDEPVVVTGASYPSYWSSEPGPVDLGVVDTGERGQCYMTNNRFCQPPVELSPGGKVVRNPVVRAVFVGSWWTGQPTLRGAIDNLFSNMSGSGLQSVLTQYYDAGGYISPTVTYDGHHVIRENVPAQVSSDQVARYAMLAAKAKGWRADDSTVWVVLLPSGSVSERRASSGDGVCGYQGNGRSGTRTYILAVVDAPAMDGVPGCQAVPGNPRATLTRVAAHEYAGAVTNPFLTGWRDAGGTRYHLPDLCQKLEAVGPGGERAEHLWSNADFRCVSSFTPRREFTVRSVTKPTGDEASPSGYTRGHQYGPAVIEVENTGNVDWPGPTIRLHTAGGSCSPFYDRGKKAFGWVHCSRIAFSRSRTVRPGDRHSFVFTLRPDGSFHDGTGPFSAPFELVVGGKRVANTGPTPPTLAGIHIHSFDAEVFLVGSAGYVAAGQHGMDTKVAMTLVNRGSATWYPNEVMYVGTPPGTTSRYAAAGWPRGPNGCAGCRAHRFAPAVRVDPGGRYSFELTLHIPDDKSAGVLDGAVFYPYADVPWSSGGQISSKQILSARINVYVVLLPKPLAAHEVTGDAVAGGDSAEPEVRASGFTCFGIAGADALSTAVTACTAQVTTAAGLVRAAAAPATRYDGRAATTTGSVAYDPGAGDVITLCWTVAATFLDGSEGTYSACRT